MVKRTLLFFVAICVSAVATFAQDVIKPQNNDDTLQIVVQEIDDVDVSVMKSYEEIMTINDMEVLEYFKTHVGGKIYNTFNTGCRLRRTGSNLLASGLMVTAVGVAGTIVGFAIDNPILFILGVTALGVGDLLITISIPFNAVGGGLKKTAENIYRETYFGNKHTSFHKSLNFGFTTNGIGLTLNF